MLRAILPPAPRGAILALWRLSTGRSTHDAETSEWSITMIPNQTASNVNNNHIHWIYWLAWLTLLAGVCSPVAWGDSVRMVKKDKDDKSERRTYNRDRRAEVNFMQQLMDQERSAIEIARVGRARSSRSEMRTFYEGVESAGQRRIDRLSGWLSDWYGVQYTPTITAPYDRQVDVLNSARVRGASEFDIRALKVTADQHQDEISIVDRNRSQLTHRELRDMAGTIADKRARDIKQLQYWLKTWYDISYTPQAPQPY